jgi:hypothetical protein
LRYDPADGTFEHYETPGDEIMFGVWGSALNDVWSVGGDFNEPDDGGAIWHFDGTSWTVYDISDLAPDGLPTLYKIWGRAADEIYACGRLGTVLRWDGESWSLLGTDPAAISAASDRTFFTIHGNDSRVVTVGGSNNGVIQELSGDMFVEHAENITPQMNGVFVSPDGVAVAVGIAGLITRRDAAGDWPLQSTVLNTILDFHAAWVDDDGGIWAVGGNLGSDLNNGIVAYFGDQSVPDVVSP